MKALITIVIIIIALFIIASVLQSGEFFHLTQSGYHALATLAK